MGFFSDLRGLFRKRQRAKLGRKSTLAREVKARAQKAGRPHGRPHKKAFKEFHKKVSFNMRVDKNLITEFKAFCESRGVSVNQVFELYIRSVLTKNSAGKVLQRLRRPKTATQA